MLGSVSGQAPCPARAEEPALQDDLLVVGLDLETGLEVHVDDAGREHWYARGYSGRRTLVCALRYAGIDAEPGTRVPLVIRSKADGLRRPHFAHPPGQAPAGGHHPESLWHLTAKAVFAAWARRQPGVAEVAVERCTPDRARRSDVRVRFRDGRQVALEAQATPLADHDWTTRHTDYRRQGIADVWLWHPRTRPHWVVADHGQSLWEFDPGGQRAHLLLGEAHGRPTYWWTRKDLHLYALHEPPCVGDTVDQARQSAFTIQRATRTHHRAVATTSTRDRRLCRDNDLAEEAASREQIAKSAQG